MTRNSQSQYEFQRRLKASMDRHRRILNRLAKARAMEDDIYILWVRVEPVSSVVATSCPWDVEEWFNTYKELLEREEEDSDK